MNAADNSHHLKLELDADPEAIHGTIERGDGTREQFWGWLELMAALERATAASATPPDHR
jgi:hypothetical protein